MITAYTVKHAHFTFSKPGYELNINKMQQQKGMRDRLKVHTQER